VRQALAVTVLMGVLGTPAAAFAICGPNFASCPQQCEPSSCIQGNVMVPAIGGQGAVWAWITRQACTTVPSGRDVTDIGWGLYQNPEGWGGSWWAYGGMSDRFLSTGLRQVCITGSNNGNQPRGMYIRVWFE
jgi:hypothetical protein